ncbi:MAG TPA: GrpB family protein [Candidatus Sumerlaeota bacterium]|nr:GrpB family protein [Candidatus Sumerlaeota bacterium]
MNDKRTPDSSSRLTPEREAELLAATVGAPERLDRSIHLEPYDPVWPQRYAHMAEEIRRVLGDRVRRLEHVGSTSVPGLSAKPVIDMVLTVEDSSDEDSYVQPLEQIGYSLRIREPGWHEHRLLRPSAVVGNLHVFSEGCTEVDQMLLFRDWLRSHPEDRVLYETTKQNLARQVWKYMQEYADAKGEVVQRILQSARRGSPRI